MERTTLTRRFATTPGTRDVLPHEAGRLVDVQTRIRERFRLFGFGEVITPALEYSEVIDEPRLRDASFKLFDPDNQMVMLRPEMTTPIARLVAQRLAGSPYPRKLSYVLPVYRRASVGRGQSAELYQAGVEVVGASGAQEDASTIALLVDVLSSLGLRAPQDFAIVLGHAAFYRSFLEHVAPEAVPEVMRALAAKDLVGVERLVADLPGGAAEAAREIPRLVGPADGGVLEEATNYAAGASEALDALDNLRGILRHLEAYGCLDAVILDLGLVGRHEYYTGAVFEAYAAGLGFTVANGGRYDNLLQRFGVDLPATGFAIYLERLLSTLPETGGSKLLLLVGDGLGATEAAGALRASGVPTLHLTESLAPEEAAAYARSVGARWICSPNGPGCELALTGVGGDSSEILGVEGVADRVFGREGVRA